MSNYYKQISELPMLEDTSTASRDELVLAHLRLVPSIVNKTYRFDHPLYDDLVQAGNVALMTAAKNYDPTKGIKFGSYAIPYIQMCVMHYVLDNKTDVRVLTTKPIRKAFFNQRKYKTADGGLDRERMASDLKITVADIREMEQRISKQYVSIGLSDSDEDDFFQIPDVESDPSKVLEHLEFEKFFEFDIQEAMKSLNDRERFIIENRYFVDETMTFHDLSIIFSVSKERIRQIELAALKKLKVALVDKFESVKE